MCRPCKTEGWECECQPASSPTCHQGPECEVCRAVTHNLACKGCGIRLCYDCKPRGCVCDISDEIEVCQEWFESKDEWHSTEEGWEYCYSLADNAKPVSRRLRGLASLEKVLSELSKIPKPGDPAPVCLKTFLQDITSDVLQKADLQPGSQTMGPRGPHGRGPEPRAKPRNICCRCGKGMTPKELKAKRNGCRSCGQATHAH